MVASMNELKEYAAEVLSYDSHIASKPAKTPSDLIVPVYHAMIDIYDCEDKDLALDVAKVIFYGY
jgi:hypothetical protein